MENEKNAFLTSASAVSLAIVTYNNAKIIAETLKSVKEYCGEADLYVIDNNSTDETVKIIKSDFPEIKLIKLPINVGFGAAHNQVLPLLNSKYHAVINPDIRFINPALSELYGFLEENPDIALAVPKFLNEDLTEQFTPKLQPNIKYMLSGRLSGFAYFEKMRDKYTMKDRVVKEPVDVGFCSGCLMFMRTEIFKVVGGFDERYFLYSEDADLTRTVQKYGRTVYNPNISAVHLWERGYTKSRKLFFIQIKSMLKYLWKWRGKNG